jgi:putative flippase GtrA
MHPQDNHRLRQAIPLLPQLVRYLAVGVANTLLYLAVICACMASLRVGVLASNALGYACGVLLNKRWTFNHSLKCFGQLWQMVGGARDGCVGNFAVVHLSANVFGGDPYLSQFAGIPFALLSGSSVVASSCSAKKARLLKS